MLFSLPALVLDKEKRNEIDLLITFLTPGGKIRALAKGAQKSRRRFLNLLEDLTYLRVHLRKLQKGKNLILEGADLFYLPESPRWILSKFYFFSYVSEVLSFTLPGALRKSDFEWLVNFIKFTDQKEPFNLKELKVFFELKWLQICGLYPQVWECVSCGREPKRIYYFSVPSGGILCFSCRNNFSYPLSLNQIDLLRKIVRIKVLNEVEILMKGLSKPESFSFLHLIEEFFIYHFEWEPKSLRVLKEEFLDG